MAGKLSSRFSLNTPPFHAPAFISCSSLPLQCGLTYTGPSVSKPFAHIQGCSVLLTWRLPCECIICESCPIRIKSVSCWLPASVQWEKRSGAVQHSQDPHTRASNQQDTLKNDSAFFFRLKRQFLCAEMSLHVSILYQSMPKLFQSSPHIFIHVRVEKKNESITGKSQLQIQSNKTCIVMLNQK